ncbi:hypothetical protein RB195_007426 [Necator americanus]|uniref:Nose resistant-to-fluoxetine protein N-terminal domain-containing protein n=1 Tax=Necator americanus TaxID=51031 RepID=A0ABR1C042_NECAM
MRLQLIVLFLITLPANCIYPPLSPELPPNATSIQSEIHNGNYSVDNRRLSGKTGKWKQFNKFIKKLVKIVESIHVTNGSECLADLLSTLGGASTVLATAPLCAFYPHHQCPENLPYWKLWMIDSWPRLPSGVTRKGPMFFLGDYDLCSSLWMKDIEATGNITYLRPHYCRSRTKVQLMERFTSVTSGFCLPSSCDEVVVKLVASRFIDEFLEVSGKFDTNVSLEEVACQSWNEDWNALKRILIALSIAVLLLLLAGTLVEYYILDKGNENVDVKADDALTFPGSELTISLGGNGALRKMNCFNAPSVALTYKNVPDLSQSFTKPTVLLDILCSFSIRISLKHLCRNTAREIPCLNGLKVLSTIWVILGHSCLFTLPYMDNLTTFLPELAKSRWVAPLLLNSSLAVDTFLFISGSVVASTIRKRMFFRENDRFSPFRFIYRLFMFYFHRISRLWPSLLMITVFIRFVYNHLGDGPMWSTQGVFGTMCSSEPIWPHLLFLSNRYPSHCLPWLWYTAVDVQLHMFSPLFFILLPRYRRAALIIAVLLIACSLLYQSAVYALYALPPNIFASVFIGDSIETAESSLRLLYASPIARSSPFIIGLLTGWTVSVRSTKRLSAGACVFMKVISISLLYFSLFAPFCREGLLSYVHAVLHRSAWSVALAILVWLCENGFAPEVSFVLSSHRLLLISRLSLGVFLTHEPILLLYVWTSRQPHAPHSFVHFVVCTFATFIFSLLAAFIIALVIEIPFISMEKKVFKTIDQRFDDDEYSKGTCEETNGFFEGANIQENTTAPLRTADFAEKRFSTNGTTRRMLECSSAFSMDSFFWQQEDWSREQSLIGKDDGRTEEHPMRNKSIDLEQWEKSLYSSC